MKATPTRCGVTLICCLALLLTLAPPGHAQYMYMDVNGDGVNTAADILTGSSLIAVHVFLSTNTNRAGNPTTCITSDGALDLRSTFEFIIHVSGGTVTWGKFKALLDGSGGVLTTLFAQDANDAYVWYPTPSVHAPGLYELGYVEVTPTSPSPILSFAPSTPLSGAYATAFGASCYGLQFDNTMKLGREWSDADGTYGPPGGGAITGLVWDDANGSSFGGCAPGPGEDPLKGWLVSLAPTGQVAITDAGGNYSFPNLPAGLYTVSVSSTATWNQTCPPGSAAQVVPLASGQTATNINFGMKKWPQATVDLVAKLTSSCKNAPGTNSALWVDCTNLGSDSPSATLTVTLPPENVYTSSTPSGTFDALLNTITFSPGVIHSHEVFHYKVDYSIPASQAFAWVTQEALLEPVATDAYPLDNDAGDLVPLTGSFDPNEVLVNPEGRILRPQTLTYHIGFQNTGTAPATTVIVKLDLDPNLNFPSVQIGAASHPFSFSVSGRQLIWTFNDINLPDNTTDEPGSHGSLKFTAVPLPSAPDGVAIHAMANIYFDVNPAVATNTTTNIIDSPPLLAPVPDRSVVEGSTVDQGLSASDPEADALTFTLASGPPWASVTTTGPHAGNLHLAPQNGDAGPASLTIGVSDGLLNSSRNSNVNVFTVTGIAESEVFAPQDIRLNSPRERTCLHLLPTVGHYRLADLGLSSLDLRRTAGEASPVAHALGGPAGLVSSDGSVCFATSDLRKVFGDSRGVATVTALCEGRMAGGGSLAGSIPITVHSPPGVLAAAVSPNPFNPRAMLTFRTTAPGFASVQLFNVAGRKVRALLKRAWLPAGYHEVPLDGRDDAARPLRSGIYFFRVDTTEGSQVGRVTVLR